MIDTMGDFHYVAEYMERGEWKYVLSYSWPVDVPARFNTEQAALIAANWQARGNAIRVTKVLEDNHT